MGGWAKTPYFTEKVLLVVSIAVWSLFLHGIGHPTIAIAFVVGSAAVWVAAMVLPSRLWPARTVTIEESIDLPYPCATVWDLIEPPEKAPLLEPACFGGYRVPGTPDGVGAQHALRLVNGITSVIEVIEFEPGRRAMTRTVSPPQAGNVRMIESLDPTDGGCRYTIAQRFDVRRGNVVRRAGEEALRSLLRSRLETAREVLADLESVTGDPATAPAPWPPPTTIIAAPWPAPTSGEPESPNAGEDGAHGDEVPDEGEQQAGTVTLRESVHLPWGCDAVWDVITTPEMVPVLDSGFYRTYRVPDTPDGVGEWWAHETATGATVIYETVEYLRPRRLVVQPVLPVADRRTVTTLVPVEGGCFYTVSIDRHRDASSPEDLEADERWLLVTRVRMAALQRALASRSRGSAGLPIQLVDARPSSGQGTRRPTRRLTGRDALVVSATGVAVLVLAWFEHLVLAGVLVVLVALAALLGPRLVRWLRRPRTVKVQESIRLPWSCEEVWALIESAEKAPLLEPSYRVGFPVPGTPQGVGERRAFVTPTGVIVVEEVVDVVPGRRIVTELVWPRILGRRRAVESLEPVDGGCIYTVMVEAAADRGTSPDASALRESVVRLLERTRDVLASTDERAHS